MISKKPLAGVVTPESQVRAIGVLSWRGLRDSTLNGRFGEVQNDYSSYYFQRNAPNGTPKIMTNTAYLSKIARFHVTAQRLLSQGCKDAASIKPCLAVKLRYFRSHHRQIARKEEALCLG